VLFALRSLTGSSLDFANCVFNASNDPVYVFLIQNFASLPNSTGSNSSQSRRSLLAIGGASGGTSAGRGAKTLSTLSTLRGYTILAGLRNADISYNIYNLSNPNPTRRIGASLNNIVLGGLYLHTVHKPSAFCPQSTRFSDLITKSACTLLAIQNMDGNGAIGTDPVFNPTSSLYKPLLNPFDFYNMSIGSGEVNPATGLPYGFFASSLPGRSKGYPILVSSHVSGARAKEELLYMLDGGLLYKSWTDTMNLDLLVYNPLAFIFGKFTAAYTWGKEGHIHMKFSFSGLPATSYSAQVSLWRVDQMVPDLILLVLILTYVLLTTISLASEWHIEIERRKLGHDEGDEKEKKEAMKMMNLEKDM
jgi:hypothetical protein